MKFSFIKCALVGLIILLLLQCGTKEVKQKQKNKFVNSELFADSIISGLSLKQKVALLHGMGGGNSEFGDLDIQFFGIKGSKRFGIPPLYMGHGITGVRSGRDTTIHATYFTAPIAIGCSWDTNLYSKVGSTIAKEMRALGQDLNLGPTLNIIRHPLGGRNWESYSEDPYLTSRLAVSYVKAMQSNGVICGPKHFVANNQETNRFDINNEVDERTLREIYLPAFKAAVTKGGALNIMGAYNRLNGTYMCHNKYLLDDVLRGEWGFKGFVLSDFANGIKSTKEAVDARMNVEMHRPKYYGEALVEEVIKGHIKESRVDLLLKDVLRVMHVMGLFDRDRYENKKVLHSDEHIQLSREVSQNAPVLLKNEDNILPIDNKNLGSVAVIGPNAKRFPSVKESHANYAYYLQGGGSGRTYYFHNSVVDPYTGILNSLNDNTKVTYAQGCQTPNLFAKNKVLSFDNNEKQLINEAVSIAKKSEVAIIYAGLSGFNETEGWDRMNADLPGQQNKLIQEVAKVNPNTIVVLIAGSYVDVSPWINDVKALLFAPYCGEQIGNGIADILTGKVSPSGKLPFTWPFSVMDYPKESIFRGEPYSEEKVSNVYSEGIFVGYRLFDKQDLDVMYPFGYGKSYTQFEYSNLDINHDTFPIKVRVNITNKGDMTGAEIVQLYIASKNSQVPKAPKELKGFKKVNLKPEETKTIEISLSKNDFAYFNTEQKSWMIEKGAYEIMIGSSSRKIVLKKIYHSMKKNLMINMNSKNNIIIRRYQSQ